MARAPGNPDKLIGQSHLAALRAMFPIIDTCIAHSSLDPDDIRFVTIPVISEDYYGALRTVLRVIDLAITTDRKRATIEAPEDEDEPMLEHFRTAQICSGLGVGFLGEEMVQRVEPNLYRGPSQSGSYDLTVDDMRCIFQHMSCEYPIRQAFISGIANAWLDKKLSKGTKRQLQPRGHPLRWAEMAAALSVEWLRRGLLDDEAPSSDAPSSAEAREASRDATKAQQPVEVALVSAEIRELLDKIEVEAKQAADECLRDLQKGNKRGQDDA